ncbi:MAG: hypothetical protein QM779_12130 [Propionicimonas sp.]|uniref:hypothetical protein n=1 Tax=Propionicimonas sp. TaxID=1955623 RepID=UPI003D0960CB
MPTPAPAARSDRRTSPASPPVAPPATPAPAAIPPAQGATRRRATNTRIPLVALGGVSLLCGLDAGLVRLEVWAPLASQRAGDVHGLVMVLGFLGTLISLERAQALGRNWAYLAPALYGAGALALLSPAPVQLGQLLHVEAGALFVVVYVALWRRAPRPLVAVQVLSAVLALGGALVALLVDIPSALPWLVGFVVLTIAAERAELAQLVMGPRADRAVLGLATALTLAVLAALVLPFGDRLVGIVLVVTGGWLLRNDVVRHQLRLTGQRRYLATALLAGYLDLVLAGLVLTGFGLYGGTGPYDVVVHGVFLGFAVSMVMAHAPVILPAVLGRPLPYRPALWGPLLLLHAGLVLRFTGALAGLTVAWQAGGVVTVLAMLSFLVTAVVLVVRG